MVFNVELCVFFYGYSEDMVRVFFSILEFFFEGYNFIKELISKIY